MEIKRGAPLSCSDREALRGLTYISGSEEKVVRVFVAPTTFVMQVAEAKGWEHAKDCTANGTGNTREEEVVLGATVAALGLSNKAVFSAVGEASDTQGRLLRGE